MVRIWAVQRAKWGLGTIILNPYFILDPKTLLLVLAKIRHPRFLLDLG